MIERQDGEINNIVFNFTVYNNDENRYYPTIDGLQLLIDRINESETTTKYIRFNPFYRNSKLNGQIEYDDYMFYIECRDDFTQNDLKSHWTKCMDNIYDIPHDVTPYDDFSDDKQKMARILYPLCKNNDVESFHKHLDDFKGYLNELLPMLFEDAIKKLNLTQEDLAFGYFCFEVHSG